MRKNTQLKNIFCVEGVWNDNLKYQSSMRPVMELLSKHSGLKYIHHDCATKSELEYYLDRWSLKKYDDYPILYLAFHGYKNSITLMDDSIDLDYLAGLLEGKCENRILIFGSCSTLDIDLRHLKRFLKVTGALAIGGYKTDIEWMLSAAHELLLFEALQQHEFSKRGINAIHNKVSAVSKRFEELEFRMVTSTEL